MAEAHPARGLVELRRAHAEIGAQALDPIDPERAQALGELVERRVHERDALAVPGEPRAARVERERVAIEADHARVRRRLEDGLGVAAATERDVHVRARAKRPTLGERVDDLGAHHGRVLERHVGLLGLLAPHPLDGLQAGQRELRVCEHDARGRLARLERAGLTSARARHRPSSASRAAIDARSSSVVSKLCCQVFLSQSSAYLPLPAQRTSFSSRA